MANVRKNKNSIFNDPDTVLDPARNNGVTPETKLRISQVAEKISKGWTKFETVRWMEQEWGIKETSQNKYWNAALSTLAKSANDSEYVEEMRNKVLAMLERALQSEVAGGRYKEMNQTADLISRLMGFQAPRKIEAKIDTDIHFNFGSMPDNEEN